MKPQSNVEARACAGGILLHKELPPEAHRAEHVHAVSALTLTLEGSYEEDFESTRQTCSRWELQFKPPGIPHSTTTAREGGRLFIVGLESDALARWPTAASIDHPVRIDRGAATVIAVSLYEAAFGEGPAGSEPAALLPILLGRVEDVLVSVHRRDVPDWVVQVARRIRRRPAEAVSLRELALEADVHPVYLARAFRRRYGCSVGDYTRRQRIDRATSLLVETDHSLSSIALQLGYCDQAHFTRAFQRETSCTPGRFRGMARALRT